MQLHVSIKVCCQEFWYILSGLDIQLEQLSAIKDLENYNPVCKRIGSGLQNVMSHIILFLLIDRYKSRA